MTTDQTTREARDQVGPQARDIRGMLRRMVVSLTEGPVWQVLGHLLLDSRTREAPAVDIFGNIGFSSRPARGARNAEALVAFVAGEAQNPVIVATRDEDARKAIANLSHDEAAMWNRATIVLVKSDNTVEIRHGNGVATKLPTFADLQAVADRLADHIATYNLHTHPVSGAVANPTAMQDVSIPPVLDGTEVLKAQ